MSDFSAGFAGGYGKGLLQSIQSERARKEDAKYRDAQLNIQRKDQAMRIADFKQKQVDRYQESQIRSGMIGAMEEGGYPAAIDYLKTIDPERAMKFESDKLDLDKQILNNDRLANLTDIEKKKALTESYGLGGKAAAAIFKAAPEEQAKLYQTMFPYFDKLVPGMPKTFNSEAQTKLRLMQAQGTPESVMYASDQAERKAQSTIGKLHADYRSALQRGDNAEAESLAKGINAEREKRDADMLQGIEARQQIAKKNQQMQFDAQKMLDKYSKPYTDSMEALKPVVDTLKILENDPNNYKARSMLNYKVARMAERAGPLTKDDLNRISGIAGYKTVSLAVQSIFSGNNVALAPEEIEQVKKMAKVYIEEHNKSQKDREDKFFKTFKYDPNNFLRPSEMYDNLQVGQQQFPPELQQEIDRAIKSGKDPKIVMERAKQLMQKQTGAPSGQ